MDEVTQVLGDRSRVPPPPCLCLMPQLLRMQPPVHCCCPGVDGTGPGRRQVARRGDKQLTPRAAARALSHKLNGAACCCTPTPQCLQPRDLWDSFQTHELCSLPHWSGGGDCFPKLQKDSKMVLHPPSYPGFPSLSSLASHLSGSQPFPL